MFYSDVKNMRRLKLQVTDTFLIEKRGLIAAVAIKIKNINVAPNEKIEILRPDGTVFKTKIFSIPMSCPYDPELPFSFLFPQDVTKEDVPIGSEIIFAE